MADTDIHQAMWATYFHLSVLIYLPCSFVDYYIPDFIAVFVVVLAHIRPSDGLGPPFCVLSVYLILPYEIQISLKY